MQLETLIGVTSAQLDEAVQDKRIILLSPQLRNRNAVLAAFVNKGKILEIPITAASCDVLRDFALRVGFCFTRYAASHEVCTRKGINLRVAVKSY